MYNIDYNDLIQNDKKILEYALKTSDVFSVISIIQKPYSRIPPNFKNLEFAEKLEPFVLKYLYNYYDWPIKHLSRINHSIMVLYKINSASRKIIIDLPNVFLPLENNLPQDICFFREGRPWLITISHEKIAYIDNPSINDLKFLESIGISL